MNNYDLVVIGAGPGGYVCAIRAAQLGLNTAIVEKRWLGGVCLNVGCIPTKALLRNAELVDILEKKGKEFGIEFDSFHADYSKAVKRSRQVSGRLTRGVEFLMKKNEIDVYWGEAKIAEPGKVLVTDKNLEEIELLCKDIVIATGAKTKQIPGIEIDGEKILDYEDAILQETLPGSVIIVGAGAIGTEFATIWNAYGSEVTLIEMLPRVLPLEDPEISSELAKVFQKKGINILADHRVEKISSNEEVVTVVASKGENQEQISADQVLVAVGFNPNINNLGLDDAGIRLDNRGFIDIDETMRTNIEGIWAIGDVTGEVLLAHVASAQGVICAEAIAGEEPMSLNYQMVPRVTFSQPQVASFGFTEKQAGELGYDIEVGKFPFLANGKALGLGEREGFIKIVVDKEYGDVIGAHMIGADVGELLPELTLANQAELSIEEIARNIHVHPTLSEAIMEAAHVAMGRPIQI